LRAIGGQLKIGSTVRVRLIIPHKGQSFGFDLYGKVKRMDSRKNGVGGIFVDMDADTQKKTGKTVLGPPALTHRQ